MPGIYTDVWTATGHGLLELRRDRAAWSWLARWRHRTDLNPYHLAIVALAARRTGEHIDARGALLKALEGGLPNVPPDLLAWRAFDAAVDGQLDESARVLDAIDGADLGNLGTAVRELGAAILAANAGEDREAAFRQAMVHLELARVAAPELRFPGPDLEPALARALRQALACIRSARGGARAWLWWLGTLARQRSSRG